MSRSYRHTPVIKDHNKGAKREANHRVRRAKYLVGKGKYYRKLYERYDVCDWRQYITLNSWIACGERRAKEFIAMGLDTSWLHAYYSRTTWLKVMHFK